MCAPVSKLKPATHAYQHFGDSGSQIVYDDDSHTGLIPHHHIQVRVLFPLQHSFNVGGILLLTIIVEMGNTTWELYIWP